MCSVCPTLRSRVPHVWKPGSTHGVGCQAFHSETTTVSFSAFWLVFMAFVAASLAEPGPDSHCCYSLDLFLLRLYSGLLSGRAQCRRPVVDYTKSCHSLTGIPSAFLRYKNNYFYFLVVSGYYFFIERRTCKSCAYVLPLSCTGIPS